MIVVLERPTSGKEVEEFVKVALEKGIETIVISNPEGGAQYNGVPTASKLCYQKANLLITRNLDEVFELFKEKPAFILSQSYEGAKKSTDIKEKLLIFGNFGKKDLEKGDIYSFGFKNKLSSPVLLALILFQQ